ncbi:MAG: GNAT family N-acetyltransferase [Alphaproteobacteria bacterium]|nr:GNAT family N-acetyltransferase [Alphaproteobacteria bacterium]
MNPLAAILEVAFGLIRALIEGILGAFGLALKRAVTPIEVRRAEPGEVVDLRHRVLRAGRPRETAVFDGDTKPTTRHWVAVQADRIVGVVSVMAAEMAPPHPDPRPRWQLRGMAVEEGLRGSGVGRAMLETVHADVNDAMWCNARANVEPFYARSGWVRSGDVFEIENVGPHVRMTWAP